MYLAYIDPGSGAIVLQLLMAVILGASFYFRKAISRILGLGRHKKNEKNTETDNDK